MTNADRIATDEREVIPTGRSIALNDLSWRFADARQLPPAATSVNPDGAIAAKSDNLSGGQCRDLLDLSGFLNLR